MARSSTCAGFTLWECLLTLLLISTLAASAIPSLRRHSIELAVYSDRQAVHALFSTARRLALRHGRPITLCPLNSERRCTDNWNDRLAVFYTPAETDPAPGSLQIITRRNAAASHWRRMRPAWRKAVNFLPDGRAPGAQGHIAFCVTENPPAVGRLILSASGRVRYLRGDPDQRGCQR